MSQRTKAIKQQQVGGRFSLGDEKPATFPGSGHEIALGWAK